MPAREPLPGHAVTPGIVDYDEVDSARLLALGRRPVPAPPPMIGSPRPIMSWNRPERGSTVEMHASGLRDRGVEMMQHGGCKCG